LEADQNFHTVQELLGHADARTMLIYRRLPNRGGQGVHSPLKPTQIRG
jgi:hypothetical protein